jgi:hypothetical protein
LEGVPIPNPINVPAGYAPAFAVGFSDSSGGLRMVNDGAPLPVTSSAAAPLIVQTVDPGTPPALTGTLSASAVVGPFTPVSTRAVMLTLSGAWTGSVQLQRSIDGGSSRHPVTLGGAAWARFTANACEPVWSEEEQGATVYLAIVLASGSLTYRLSQ